MNMNDEQRKLAEDNMTLVHFIINKYFPQHNYDDDVIQAGMVGLCKATMAWDKDKGAFSTIATNYILNHIRTHFGKNKQKAEVLSLEYEYDDSMTLADVVKGDSDVSSVCGVIDFLSNETETNQKVLLMLAQGYKSKEIAEILGMTRSNVNTIKRMAKLRWGYMYDGEPEISNSD